MSGKWNREQGGSSGGQPSEKKASPHGGLGEKGQEPEIHVSQPESPSREQKALPAILIRISEAPLLNFVWPLTRKVIGAVMTWVQRVWPFIWHYLRDAVVFVVALLIQHGWKERKEHPRIAAATWIISLVVVAAYGLHFVTSVVAGVDESGSAGSQTFAMTELAPPNSFAAMPVVTETPPREQFREQSSGCQYTVVPGDNLFRISLRYNTTVGTLARVNNIADPNMISVGQVLTVCSGAIPEISQPAPVVSASESSCITHTIEPGENLFRISLRYNASVEAIAERNAIADVNLIIAGQEIQICQEKRGT